VTLKESGKVYVYAMIAINNYRRQNETKINC
jgi:hypothetical protein